MQRFGALDNIKGIMSADTFVLINYKINKAFYRIR